MMTYTQNNCQANQQYAHSIMNSGIEANVRPGMWVLLLRIVSW